jgi:hypothetical protein
VLDDSGNSDVSRIEHKEGTRTSTCNLEIELDSYDSEHNPEAVPPEFQPHKLLPFYPN